MIIGIKTIVIMLIVMWVKATVKIWIMIVISVIRRIQKLYP